MVPGTPGGHLGAPRSSRGSLGVRKNPLWDHFGTQAALLLAPFGAFWGGLERPLEAKWRHRTLIFHLFLDV